jgi:hypothetical protein
VGKYGNLDFVLNILSNSGSMLDFRSRYGIDITLGVQFVNQKYYNYINGLMSVENNTYYGVVSDIKKVSYISIPVGLTLYRKL